VMPDRPMCCGRPLYDYGFLDEAKRYLERILRALTPEIEAGVPVVFLEPSCASVFRDELSNLLPARPHARTLAEQSFFLTEYLNRKSDYRVPVLHRRALVHGHCHHKAVLDFDAEKKLLHAMELDFEVPASGCCGMAGSFGFERDHYDVSVRIGEHALLPAVRRAPADSLIVANGFSCRTQIREQTGREALHVADLLHMGVKGVG